MDALDLLIADHNRVRGLFARFKEAQQAEDAATMGSLAETIFEELRVHTTIEEKVFYPAIREADEELADTIYEGLEEHHVADLLRDESRRLEPGDPVWAAKLTVLIENVEHHIDEEESDMFPQVRSATVVGEREKWGASMERMKADLGAAN